MSWCDLNNFHPGRSLVWYSYLDVDDWHVDSTDIIEATNIECIIISSMSLYMGVLLEISLFIKFML